MTEPLSWPTADAADVGLDSEQLDAAWSDLEERSTKAFLVVRRGQLVYERYHDFEPDQRHYTASLAKALVGGLALAVATDDGLVNADDRAADYIPSWGDDPLKSKITLRHLASHTSGIEDAEVSQAELDAAQAEGRTLATDHMEMEGWKGAFWRGTNSAKTVDGEPDPFTLARDSAPVIFEPGSRMDYSNPGIAMLGYCLGVALQRAGQPDVRELLRTRIFEPLGLRPDDWAIGYGTVYEVDGLPLIGNWGGGSLAPRATARIGQMLVNGGSWDGRQLIAPQVVQQVTSFCDVPADLASRDDGDPAPATTLGWWGNVDAYWPGVPADTFIGAGAGDQILLCIPSLDLVVVRNGGALLKEEDKRSWLGRLRYLVRPVVESIAVRSPVPPSPVIRRIDWDPPAQVRRCVLGARQEKGRKDGSDNWPLTWADDGNLYTAYGDGYGFEPRQTDTKLSLGFGVVTGMPDDFAGYNIRSDGERLGPGRSGEKASGLLCVDGTIYLWVRNADLDGHAGRLAWSDDHMKTWQWASWSFAEFGHPSFVNFGQDYTDARDDYVYITSHDSNSAYEQADRYLLARVPKDKIREPDHYEFFVGTTEGHAIWAWDLSKAGAIFVHPGQCRRSSMSFVPGLDRYILWQQLTFDSTDTRFDGGFGLYDAPEPWGPWTTVFFTDRWDVGPGDLGHVNAKWSNRNELWLVFAGSDNFCARRGRLTLY